MVSKVFPLTRNKEKRMWGGSKVSIAGERDGKRTSLILAYLPSLHTQYISLSNLVVTKALRHMHMGEQA